MLGIYSLVECGSHQLWWKHVKDPGGHAAMNLDVKDPGLLTHPAVF